MADKEQVKQDLAVAVSELGATLKSYEGAIKSNEKIGKDLQEQMKAVEARVKQHHDDLIEMQKEAGRLDAGVQDEHITIGQILTEHDEYKRFEPGTSRKNESGNVKIKGGFFNHRKDLTSTTGGDGVINYRDPRLVEIRYQALTIRDLIPTFMIGSNTAEFIKETRFNNLMAQLVATAAAGQKDILVDNIGGFYTGQTITLATGEADEEDLVIGSIAKTGVLADVNSNAGTITCTTNLASEQTTLTLVTSDTFVFTPEATLKPRTDYEVDSETATVKTLSHFMAVTRQILADAPQLRRQVDAKLMFGLGREEERQLLYGDGTTNQLAGIMTDSDIQDYAWSSGRVGDTKLDAIRRAMTLSFLAQLPPTGVVVHPSDWEEIETVKGSNGHYIWAAVPGGGIIPMVWRIPVIVTNAIASGDALVGAWDLGATIYDREQSNVRMSESHKDYFARNMVAILAEERLAFAVNNPESFVAVDFDNTPV